jgi:hypothetical protein
MANPWDEMADSIIATVEERAKGFLDQNEPARKIVTERAKRLAELGFHYQTSGDETHLTDMKIVRQTVENELAALALAGQSAAKDTFMEIVRTAFGLFAKALPAILAAI